MILPVLLALACPQQSLAQFNAAVPVVDYLHRFEFLTDFNQDGETDAISFYQSTLLNGHHDLAGFAGDGAGGFTQSWRMPIPWGSQHSSGRGLGKGDLDGDGREDFVGSIGVHFFAARFTSQVHAPTVTQMDTLPFAATHIELADVTGDGYADAIMATDGEELKVYMNGGPSVDYRLNRRSSIALPSYISGFVVGDLTGDGVPDVATSSFDGVRIWPIDSAGRLQAPSHFPDTEATFYAGLTIGDIDGDGDDDLVAFEQRAFSGAPGEFTVYRRTGPEVLTREAKVIGGPATHLADVDGDGDLDGVCCGGGGGTSSPDVNRNASRFEISMNDGTGAFVNAFQIQGLGAHHIAGVVDLDHDGDMDLIGGRAVYYPKGPITRNPYRNGGTRERAESVMLDLDGDGDRDLGVGSEGMLRSRGDGTFVDAAIELPAAPAGFAYTGLGYPGDWNGDGTVDMLFGSTAGGAFASMRLLVNVGGGHMIDGGVAGPQGVDFFPGYTDSNADFMCVDVDGDGDKDLVVLDDFPSGSLEPMSMVWWNDGEGVFSTSMAVHRILEVADLTNDGLPDLLVAVRSSDNGDPEVLARRVATAPGVFGPAYRMYQGSFSSFVEARHDRIAVLDYDGDGDLDVFSCSHNKNFAGTLSRWENRGPNAGGVELVHRYMQPGLDPWSESIRVFAVDVNGDGLKDLVGGPLYLAQGASAVFLRDPSGSGFLPAQEYCILPEAFDDRDGDGDADVVGEFLCEALYINGDGGRRQYGDELAGTDGARLILGSSGSCRVGEDCTLHVRGGIGGARVFVTLGMAESNTVDAPFPGLVTYNHPWFRRLTWIMDGVAGEPGAGSLDHAFTMSPALAGLDLFLQAWALDPAGPMGLVHSGGLELGIR